MISIRNSVIDDASVLAEISKASMTSAWSQKDFLDAMASDLAVCLTATDGDDIAGYMVMYHAADEGEIPSVAVHSDYRRRGIGHALMTELFAHARTLGLSRIFLEVRASNEAAIELYKKHGFLCVGERKNFYSDPIEDALIYTTILQ